MTSLGAQPHYQHQAYANHSVMENGSDGSDDEGFMQGDIITDHQHSYHQQQQQQQATYYQQHQYQQQYGQSDAAPQLEPAIQANEHVQDGVQEEEMYSDDDESSTASIPDENIDFSLTYAL